MNKLPMYIILGVTMAVGGYVPVMFGQSSFGGWSLLGSTIGGIVGIYIYVKARQNGYID